ncbi:trypsin-like serine peptidase [Streptomyces sp. NPDC020917]|uniref:trypsin-like serine peptidase n=1 Tax=Streptomyces sp. NPDC020917 TaxID=3365102 RepID=UPI00378D8345
MPSIRRSLATAAAAVLLAGTATACGSSSGGGTDARPTGGTATVQRTTPAAAGLPTSIPTSLKDLKKWEQAYKDGGWRDWNRSTWLRKAKDFANPVIAGLWSEDRMRGADQNDKQVPADVPADQGMTDPEPSPVPARAVTPPYHVNAAGVGKLFFDGPQGSMVCSATVVEDPAHPGKSNLVWTAGHCVHAGKEGGWYRNIAFVPAYNDGGRTAAGLKGATRNVLAPLGVFWADWASTSDQWIDEGSEKGGSGSPYDFAVLHVVPEKGAGGKSLQETVGAALPVWFDAPSTKSIPAMGVWGYPAAPPYDGQRIYACTGRPGRLSLDAQEPTEYRIGCTMTGGASGGGWFATMPSGRTGLVSNTSIGPVTNAWLAGPRLGAEAKKVFDEVSTKFR